MKKEQKQFLVWTTIAGALFLVVGIHDLLVVTADHKSGFVIALEFVAGTLFVVNALRQWGKNR